MTQSNSVDSSAKAGNLNLAGQSADQAQGGSGGTQAIGQDADNDQSATALSAAKQHGATNRNIPVRVLSPGDGGDVTQSNSVNSSADAGNLNGRSSTRIRIRAAREASVAARPTASRPSARKPRASSPQARCQWRCSPVPNTNTPVRVGSKGDDGDVSQSNSVESNAKALNVNLTGQHADQAQAGGDCRCATAARRQSGRRPERPVRSGCFARGSVGRPRSVRLWLGREHQHSRARRQQGQRRFRRAVEQRRFVGYGGNLNLTGQLAGQGQAGGGTQAIGQDAKNEQTHAPLRRRCSPAHRTGTRRCAWTARAMAATSRSRTTSTHMRPR